MKKKLLSILLATMLVLTCIPMGALSVSAASSNGFEYSVSSNKATITGYTGAGGAITIPAKLGNYPVVAIGNKAFQYCDTLTSVTIGSSVTSIGNYAFYGCNTLTSVAIGNNVTTIGDYAFYYCNSLTSVTIPNSVTAINEGTFYSCANLASVTIGSNVTSIGGYAFRYCDSLTSVTIPNNVTTIGDCAFDKCVGLESVTLGDSVLRISTNAFYGCNSLTAIHVTPNNPTYSSLDGVMFNKDKTTLVRYPIGRSGAYTIPDGVTSIRTGAFYRAKLTALTIGNDVATIGSGAFQECDALASITLGDGITTIEDNAFMDCDSLTSVTIPDSVTTIGRYAFCQCYGLTSVTIGDNVTSIGDYAFMNCKKLPSITIPVSVTTVGYNAFYNCTGLTDVYYAGDEASREEIEIDTGNDPLLGATWHYNYVDPAKLFSPDAQNSAMDTENGSGLAFRFELAAKGVTKDRRNVADLTNATVNYLGQECKLVAMGAVMTNDDAVGATAFTLADVYGDSVIDVPAVYLQEAGEESCAFATRIIDIPESALERTIYARPYYVVEVNGEQITVYGDVDAASCAEYL